MTLNIYGLKNCDTCRKANKALKEAHEVTFIDIRGEDVGADDIKLWLGALGADKLLNKKSTTWRGLDEADKSDLSDENVLALLTEHRALIKRPVISYNGQLTLGWTKDVQASFGL